MDKDKSVTTMDDSLQSLAAQSARFRPGRNIISRAVYNLFDDGTDSSHTSEMSEGSNWGLPEDRGEQDGYEGENESSVDSTDSVFVNSKKAPSLTHTQGSSSSQQQQPNSLTTKDEDLVNPTASNESNDDMVEPPPLEFTSSTDLQDLIPPVDGRSNSSSSDPPSITMTSSPDNYDQDEFDVTALITDPATTTDDQNNPVPDAEGNGGMSNTDFPIPPPVSAAVQGVADRAYQLSSDRLWISDSESDFKQRPTFTKTSPRKNSPTSSSDLDSGEFVLSGRINLEIVSRIRPHKL